MYINKTNAQLTQNGERHGHIIYKRTALARGCNHTTDDGLRLVVDIILLKDRLQTIPLNIEYSLNNATARLITQCAAIVLIAEQKAQRTEQYRLTRTRLTRDDIEVSVEFEIELLDQSIVLYGKSSEHRLYLLNLIYNALGNLALRHQRQLLRASLIDESHDVGVATKTGTLLTQ